MLWRRQVFGPHRTHFRPYQALWSMPSGPLRMSTCIDSKIDFVGVEQKWQRKWDSRGTKIQEERDTCLQYNPIIPFYMDHIRRHTIMGTLQSMLLSEKRATTPRSSQTSMVEQILASYDSSPCDYQLENLHTYTQRYGKDAVRTCIIFSQGAGTEFSIHEQSIVSTQRWFEHVWDAVRVAHESYENTKSYPPLIPPDLETGNDPDLTDKIIDFDMARIQSFVHVPPASPGTPGMDTDRDTCALWLASQEAILAMTRKSKAVNPHVVRSRLSNLIFSIIYYEEGDSSCIIECGVHYHSARILLSLIAPFAPSFAEECWTALHYGRDQWRDPDAYELYEEDDTEITLACYEDLLCEDLMEHGYQDLPRQSDPDTLSTIFAQPFPAPESCEMIKSLRRRSAGSIVKRTARREAKNDLQRWKESLAISP
ncbi:hypothetical protein P154DRAFT_616226 [Amniculicola lignicola CBS 123094]|uniref:Methionyl/Valyl/Leucyl/Isoleucyl-tRNA synthetase anticodon-binding domain-containing protein n=1 Tax=Amniculicola lignicola CBS 123094 TaxID=1392246 RepID=A0A6A5WUY5_9PLEO|nr:hypothetical protein P154DRAFT_616226 [Amniculicola lignicola CBS 123094]